jgi:eukaryotic-like serine/threonine-protein kinase
MLRQGRHDNREGGMPKIIQGGHTWADLEPYLDEALDLSGSELEKYMAALARERPTVAAALADMLAESAELKSTSFLEHPVMVPAEDSLVGEQVGSYTIDSLIGRGGMGEVWLALRSDGRFEGKFAIKFLDSYAASPAALDRFRREGRLLARLAHPHIARLIDAGVSSGGRPYLVLEYVDGDRIDGYCRSHALGIEARVRLLLDVLSALAHAHGNLVVHRDIKPSNVLVTADGVAKLLDFGIAKLLNPDTDSTEAGSAPTRIEEAALTPDYAAPEQLLGEPATTATDVYQLGVLMFVLFAGRLPLATPATRAERIKAALDTEAPRASAVALESRRELRGDLDAIISKALRKLPQERYATAAALAEDLKRYLAHEPVAARANLLSYRAGKFVRRYRAAVIGTSAAIAALIAAAAFALIQMREAEIQRDRSRAQARRAEMQAEFVTLMMSTVGNRPTTAEQLLDAGVQLLDQHYTADVRFRFTAMVNLASRYSDLGLTKKQFALLEKADGIARQLDDPSLTARSQCGLAQAEIDLGDMDKAVARAAEGRAALARVADPDPLYVEDCTEAEADLTDAQGNPAAATRIAEHALALLEQVGETHDIRYSELLGRIADYYKEAGDSHRGFDYVERALNAAERNGLGNTDAAMTAMHNLASSLMNVGEVKEACAREKEVISRVESTGRTVITAMAVLNGSCFLKAGDASQALAWYDRGLAAAEKENEAYLQMHARANRARALIELQRFAEAGAELDRVAALEQQDVPSGAIPAARARIVRAELLLAEGRAEEARQILDAMLPALRAPHSGEGVFLPSALFWSARIALAQKRYTDAAAFATEALRDTERRARDPEKSADVGESWLLLAQARGALNDAGGRREAAQRAVTSLTASLGAENALTRAASAL